MGKAESYKSEIISSFLGKTDPKKKKKVKRKMLLAAQIADGLVNKKWKKRDLADAMGKNPSEVTKWLSGTHNFTVDTLEDIGHYLEIDFFGTYRFEWSQEIISNSASAINSGSFVSRYETGVAVRYDAPVVAVAHASSSGLW